VIERIFGVSKKRFKMFREANDFPIKVQGRIASAICVLHNFIHTHDPQDLEDEEGTEISEATQSGNDVIQSIPAAEAAAANRRRDQIAHDMWTQYQGVLAQREEN